MFDVAHLTKECRKAAGAEVACASDDELLAAAVEYESARSAMDAGHARVLGELRVRGVTDRRYGLKTAKWVAAQAKVDHRPIGRRMLLGARLRHLAVVDAAVAQGSITADHAVVFAEAAANPRIGDEVAATQSYWVDQAAGTSFVDWKHQVEQTVRLLDQDGGYDPDRDRDRERAQFTTFDDGLTRLAVDLVGADALEVRQLVEAQADRLFHQLKHDADRTADLPMPGRATLLAMALVELVRRGSTVDRDRSTGPAVDVTLVVEATKPGLSSGLTGVPAGDVLDDVAGSGLVDLTGSAGDRGGLGLVDLTAGSTDAIGRLDLVDPTARVTRSVSKFDGFELFDPYRPVDRMGNAIGNPLVDCCGSAKARDDVHLHPDIAAVLLCDPVITALIVDSLGVPLDMGREIRLANRKQRRALAKRDGGCIFPGCDCPVGWTDAHHVIWWEDDGPTDISNLALLCRYHHGVTHRRGWTMTNAGDHWFTWTTPSGDTLHSQRHRGRSPTAHPALRLCPA